VRIAVVDGMDALRVNTIVEVAQQVLDTGELLG
jgi:hypothetical protein